MTSSGYLAALLGAFVVGCATPMTQPHNRVQGTVIEVVTFDLKSGVTPNKFHPLDRAVEFQHVARQPGFLSRESASNEDGQWLVIVHWRSAQDAGASMASFSDAPATAEFMSCIDASTMVMKRYTSR